MPRRHDLDDLRARGHERRAIDSCALPPLRFASAASAFLYSRGITLTIRRLQRRPVRQQPLAYRLPVSVDVLHDRHLDEVDVVGVDERLQVDHLAVAARARTWPSRSST